MSYSKNVKEFNPFRPLKDFEDQIEEVFLRRKMKIKRSHLKRNKSSLRSHSGFFVQSDSKKIDDEDVLTLPVKEKVENIISDVVS